MTWAVPVLILGIGLAGCVATIHGVDQAIVVGTYPIEGAACTVGAAGKQWHITSPGQIIVPKAMDGLTVRCVAPGYEGLGVISSSFDPWAIGNIAFGGPVGFAVDGGLGTMSKYPALYAVKMVRLGVPGACYIGDTKMPMSDAECRKFGGEVLAPL